ncbi:MAG: hypothetical protein WCF48_22755, partial [Terriglobales bacterium]
MYKGGVCAPLFMNPACMVSAMGPAWLLGSWVRVLSVGWTARETAALLVAVVSLLFFKIFRERCLLV